MLLFDVGQIQKTQSQNIAILDEFPCTYSFLGKAPYFQCLHGVIIAVWFWNRNYSYCFSSFVSVAARDNGGKKKQNEYSQGRFVWISSEHFGSPQGSHTPGSDLPHCRFSSSWKEAATSHWVGHCLGWMCFSNIYLAASLNLFVCHRFEKWLHAGKDWPSLWNRNGDKHQRSWWCGRAFRVWHAAVKRWLWADPVCLRAQKPAPCHCRRPVQKNKMQVSECSIYLPSTDAIGKE